MWSQFCVVYNDLLNQLKENNAKKKEEPKDVSRFRWFFMTKWKKLMYAIPIFHRNKHRLHLGNGYILNFESMTIDTDTENSVYLVNKIAKFFAEEENWKALQNCRVGEGYYSNDLKELLYKAINE